MAAKLHHIGRVTGRSYITPVGARRKGDQILIPLTFGNQSDWSRNVMAAGRCTIRLLGATYAANRPRLVSPSDARDLTRALFPVTRLSFGLLGIKQFMLLDVA